MNRKFVINFVLLTILFNLFLIIDTNASSATLSLDCSVEVTVLGSVSCNVNVTTDTDVDSIRFTISDGDFNTTFTPVSGYTNSGTLSNVSLTSTSITTGKIGTLSVTAPGSMSTGEKTISLTNISISNSTDSSISFNPSDVSDTIRVLSNRSNNNNLRNITIDGKSISGFSSSKTEYNVTVFKNTITLGAVGDEPNTQMIDGVGEKNLVLGNNNPFNITVTAENGETKTYKVVVNYEIEKSNDNNLKTLELYNNEELIPFEFDETKTSFDVLVNGAIDKITLKSTLNDSKASYVKNYGNRAVNLKYGINKIEIRVIAENSAVKKYTLNVTRNDERNDNSTLEKLVVNDNVVQLIPDVFEYRVDVRYKYTKSEIEAVQTNKNATLIYNEIPLVDGVNEPVIITVTAENGKKQDYKVIINRLSEEVSKVVLSNIIVKGYDLNFKSHVNTYDLDINEKDDNLEIEIVPTKDLKYEVLGNSDLKDGSTIVIRVTDDDGVKSYTINIHKSSDKILGIPTNIFCYSVFGIGCLSFISSIVYAIKSKKTKKN